MEHDLFLAHNQAFWTRQVREGMQYTRPWLELDRQLILDYVEGRIPALPMPYAYTYPREVLQDIAGKKVLCLASGGGQQSAVLGLLGADVTVFDLTEAQLDGDRAASERFGYSVELVQGDMRDLSVFDDAIFDLVYQEISLVFVPDVRPVYREVFRVLKPGGTYRVGHCNAATFFTDETTWDGIGYRFSGPFRDGPVAAMDGDAMEFRHLLSDVFNGLTEAGLTIETVWEDPRHLFHDPHAVPGTEAHLLTVIQSYFAIVARKGRSSRVAG